VIVTKESKIGSISSSSYFLASKEDNKQEEDKEGVKPPFIETLRDPSEIQKLSLELDITPYY